MHPRAHAALLATVLIAACAPAAAATTPAPQPANAVFPKLPDTPLHTEFLVEVNKMGQVVRVKSGKASKSPTFNTQTYGNALQMFIRRADNTAPPVGLYKVTYDYDPKTHEVHRGVPILVTAGGSWANEEGAANRMIDTAKQEAEDAAKQQKAQAESLPSLNQLRGTSPAPSAGATLPP